MPMMKPIAAAIVAAALLSPAEAQPRHRDQDAAVAATRSGQVRPLREIEQRVLPHMAGSAYLGPEYDPVSATYRLKFMRGRTVIWIDVDARTGQIVGRSGY